MARNSPLMHEVWDTPDLRFDAGWAGEGEEMDGVSKGLFSLPFMKRAQEARKRQAEAAARDMLAELDGGAQADAEPTQGRRNFGLAGGVQVPPTAYLPYGSESGLKPYWAGLRMMHCTAHE